MKKLNSEVYHWYNRIMILPKYKNEKFSKINDFDYTDFVKGFQIPKNSQIFIHAGLKGIKQKTGQSYEEIIDNLIHALKIVYTPSAIITPSFTPSFRTSGVYSKRYSKGEYGVFSELPRHKANFRTDDAIHGVSIFTENVDNFENLNYHDTFANDGFYASLKENTYVLNICTNYFVSTYLHYIEEDLKVPYKKIGGLISKGVMYDDDNQVSKIEQNNHHYISKGTMNRDKIRNKLENNNYLVFKTYSNLISSCIKVSDLDRELREEIIKDPYYLVTF